MLPSDSYASAILGVYESSSGDEFLGSIDTNSGALITIGGPLITGPGTFIVVDNAALSPDGSTYYFVGGNSSSGGIGEPQLYTVNTASGSATYIPFTSGAVNLAASPLTGTLYALTRSGENDFLSTVNPATGTTTNIGAAFETGLGFTLGGVVSQNGTTYSFIADNGLLYSLNTATGALTGTVSAPSGFIQIEPTSPSGAVAGLYFVPNPGSASLGNEFIGTLGPLGDFTSPDTPVLSPEPEIAVGISTISPDGSTYYFEGWQDYPSSPLTLYSVNVNTGVSSAISATPPAHLADIQYLLSAPTTAVPEPSCVILFCTGIVLVVGIRIKARRRKPLQRRLHSRRTLVTRFT